VIRQVWGGDTIDIVYVPLLPSKANGNSVMKTIINDRVGNVKEYVFDSRNRVVRKREYTGRANPALPTTDLTNRLTGKLRPTDPDFFETRYEWNEDSLQTRVIHPNGNIIENVYESALKPDAPPRTRGNLRIVRHLPGTHTPAGDQAVIEELYEYDTNFGSACCGFNFVTRHVDSRGNETLNDYDERGNLIYTRHRIPSIIEDFEYNEFGQMTVHVLPDNGSGNRRRDEYTYYSSGSQRGYLRQEIIDAPHFALTTTYEYALVGNVIRMTDPRGHDTQYIVNALDQVVRVISREVTTGSGVRYQRDRFYDANNNMIRIDIQNVDAQGVLQPNTHFTTTYEYEILNYPIRMTEEVDPGHTIVTEYGYDGNRNRTLTQYGEATNGVQPTNVLRTLYDERDLAFENIRADGDLGRATTQYDYDNNENLITRQEGLEDTPRVHRYVYDGYDRLISETDPMGNVMTYHYDANSNRASERIDGELNDVAGGGGNVRLSETTFVYDAMDRRIRTEGAFFDTETQALISDGKSITQTFYSDNSQIIRAVDDNNHQTLTTYDTANRVSVVTDAKGNATAYTYDPNSNVVSSAELEKSDLGNPDEIFVTNNTYDNLDRLIRTVDNVGNINRYAYDSRGNRTLHTDAKGNVTRFVYDGLNCLTETIRELTDTGDGSGGVIDTITTAQTWDDTSRLVAQTDDNGKATTYTYDPLNRKTATRYADGTIHRTT